MRIPKQRPCSLTRRLIRSFPGYDHRSVSADGACYDMENLTCDDYPVLSVRAPRAMHLKQVDGTDVQQAAAMIGKEHLFVVNRDGSVSSNGHTMKIGLKTENRYTVKTIASYELEARVDQQTFLAAVQNKEGRYVFQYEAQERRWFYRVRQVDISLYGIAVLGQADDHDQIIIEVTKQEVVPVSLLPKKLVSVGAMVCIWPDKCFVNAVKLAAGETMIEEEDFGKMEKTYDTDEYIVGGVGISITVQPCKEDGTAFMDLVSRDTAPANPQDAAYWRDTSNLPYVIRQYNAATQSWNPITFYTSIQCQDIEKFFCPKDRIRIGCYENGKQSEKIAGQEKRCEVIAVDTRHGQIVVSGLQINKAFHTVTNLTRLTACLPVPEMNFVVECGNRLWGCFYGKTENQYINEIYASALGNFRNWETLEGVSTDAYTASRGSDGAFTGAAVLGGCPLFFKENCIEKVFPSAVGAHRIVQVSCDGIQEGSWQSAVVIDGVLYYKSPNGVCCYTGSLPTHIDAVFGDMTYYRAVGGRQNKKYYLSMQSRKGQWSLFCYDTAKHLWCREDETRFLFCADYKGSLYYQDETHQTSAISDEGSERINWRAESGLIGLVSADNKYISRIDLRMAVQKDTECSVWVSYNDFPGQENWILKRTVEYTDCAHLKTLTVPILPRRCDHMRIRLTGKGAWKLYSVGYCVENGSDENA